jgi:hypothetical protein
MQRLTSAVQRTKHSRSVQETTIRAMAPRSEYGCDTSVGRR